MGEMPVALTIAGSDSSAGAGIQADLKTFSAFDIYGVSAITAITAQNTVGVSTVFPLPVDLVRAQIEAVSNDIPLSAYKTGMLATTEIVNMVADLLRRLRATNLVVDPVMRAGGGDGRTLLAQDAVETMMRELFPLAAVVTPNVAEASTLSGIEVSSLKDARAAAQKILDLGPKTVIIKGGHLAGPNAVDLFFDGQSFTELSSARNVTEPVHGTGCTFASAIAARLAVGDDVQAAVQKAKEYIAGAIEHSMKVGSRARLLDHFWMRGYTQA